MEHYFEKMGYKKAAVLFVLLGVVLIIFLMVSILGVGQKQNPSQALNPTPTSDPFAVAPTAIPTKGTDTNNSSSSYNLNLSTQVQTYTGSTYRFIYPIHWSIQQNINGEILYPGSDHSNTFMLSVEVLPDSPTQESITQNTVTSLHLQPTKITVDGIQAKEYSGVIGSTSDIESKQISLVETIISMVNKGNLYTISFIYKGTTPNQAYEQFFTQWLSHFSYHL